MFILRNQIYSSSTKLNYTIVKNNDDSNNYTIYIYNNRFFFLIRPYSMNLECNPYTLGLFVGNFVNSIPYITRDIDKSTNSLFYNKLNSLIFSWDSYYFKKFIIDGKAYRINKFRNNNFKLLFGRSHKTLFITKNLFLIKKKKIKKKFMFYGSNLSILNHGSNVTYRVRPNDMYTARGIRFSKSVAIRKLGKKGATSVI